MHVSSLPTQTRFRHSWGRWFAFLVVLASVTATLASVPASAGPDAPEPVRRLRAEPAPEAVTLRWRAPVDAGAHDLIGYRVRHRGVIAPHPAGSAGPDAGRVFGGETISLRQAPWQVAVLSPGVTGINAQFCGGSVIHPRWILTAAHCVTNRRGPVAAGDIQIGDGITDLDRVRPGQRIDVDRIIVHPDWFISDTFRQVDLALIELDRPVRRSEPIALDRRRVTPAGTEGWVTGWGSLEADFGNGTPPNYPSDLQGGTVQVLAGPGDSCGRYGIYNEAEHVCAADPGRVDTCPGDSGGPLALLRNDQWVLSGVTSFGVGCGRPAFPGVYARVSPHVRWITGYVDELGWRSDRTTRRSITIDGLVDGLTYRFDVAARTPTGLGAATAVAATPGS